jgi:hypothetical protein
MVTDETVPRRRFCAAWTVPPVTVCCDEGVCSASMTARERQGYKGPVREVRIERQYEKGASIHVIGFDPDGRLVATAHINPDGSEYRQAYTYGDDGAMIDPCRDVKILRNPDGSRREIERVPVEKNLGWGCIEGLEKTGGMAFPTREASQVDVSYDARGVGMPGRS